MASIGEVTDRLREVLTSCGAAADHLRDADELLQAALEALALALTGANDDESIRALRLGLATVGEARDAVHAAADGVRREVGRFDHSGPVGSGATGGATEKPASPKQPRAAPAGRPAAEQIRRLRDELPPDVLPPGATRTRGTPPEDTRTVDRP
ncbi:hypothetical protein [Kutzneria sp. 744]|uniref:hypothetical protein n=1 Tax=Kutzneria sp. (strain 744) TaxID=345341 RepID=UPI0003EEB830|nr:hypothetical protein [Kutzneria sp. 744]EWM10946.1 hypothetical protein KUTG_01250 [Kutzneria sp. 744]